MQAEERAELESEMHMRFGVHLFGEGDYDGAMAHFGMCSAATPVLLLKLFPSLAPTALMEPIAPCFPGAHSLAYLPLVTRLRCQRNGCRAAHTASDASAMDAALLTQRHHASALGAVPLDVDAARSAPLCVPQLRTWPACGCMPQAMEHLDKYGTCKLLDGYADLAAP